MTASCWSNLGQNLQSSEVKHVAKAVLQALALHEEVIVHTVAWKTMVTTSTMVTVEAASAMSNWRTAGIAHTSILSWKSIPLGPLSFEALKRCLIFSGVHLHKFGLWELQQGSPYDTDRCVLSTDSVKLLILIWGEIWHILKPSNIDPTDSAYPIVVVRRQDECFGPFPLSYTSLTDNDRLDTVTITTESVEKRTPSSWLLQEIAKEDRHQQANAATDRLPRCCCMMLGLQSAQQIPNESQAVKDTYRT